MRILDADQTRAALPYEALVHSIGHVLDLKKHGRASAPERVAVSVGADGALLLMPATDGEIAITKLVTVHPGNGALGLPTVQSDVLVMDACNGSRLALLEGSTVTARRTAALSVLAAMRLAPRRDGPLLLIGAGVQGRAHLEAFGEVLGIREVVIYSKTPEGSRSLADHARSLGLEARAVETLSGIIENAPLIVTATTSKTPVLPDRVRDDAFVAAVGAFTPEMAELPPSLVRRASVYVDTLEGARSEAGDILQAHLDWQTVTPLEDTATAAFVRPTGPVVFKSVGHALFDLAAARLALMEFAHDQCAQGA